MIHTEYRYILEGSTLKAEPFHPPSPTLSPDGVPCHSRSGTDHGLLLPRRMFSEASPLAEKPVTDPVPGVHVLSSTMLPPAGVCPPFGPVTARTCTSLRELMALPVTV